MSKRQILTEIAEKIDMLNRNEICKFLKAILTKSEIEDLQKRYLIIEKLLENKTHREIAGELSVSISKVTRGANELKCNESRKIFTKIFENLK